MNKAKYKRYIGDGVYADYDGFSMILTCENGFEIQNQIYLDDDVIEALTRYIEDLGKKPS